MVDARLRYLDTFSWCLRFFVGYLYGCKELVAHTGLEPVISALRGQRVNQLHQCALPSANYSFAAGSLAS